MLRRFDAVVRSNLHLYGFLRSGAVFVCRYFLLEEGFSILKWISPNQDTVAIDVGSNDGTSIAMIHQLHPTRLIHSFDPVIPPKTRQSNSRFHNVALSDRNGQLNLFVPEIHNLKLTQYSSTSKEKIISQLIEDFRIKDDDIKFSEISSECLTLDSFKLNPFFLKIDVEGQEDLVLVGSRQTIEISKPIILVEIQTIKKYEQISKLMTSLDYFNLEWPQKSKTKNLKLLGTFRAAQNNYVWLPKNNSENWHFTRFK